MRLPTIKNIWIIMVIGIKGNSTVMRISQICSKFYHCESADYEISRNFHEDPYVTIKHDKPMDAVIFFTLSPDNMSATGAFVPAINGGATAAYDSLIKDAAGGARVPMEYVDEDACLAAYNDMKKGTLTDNVTVAVGKYPIHGIDAKMQLFVELPTGKPLRERGGKTLYRELKKYVSVAKDQLLLKINPLTKGEAGYNVTGGAIPNVEGKPVPCNAGDGVRTNEEGTEFYAATSGYVIYKQNMISVKPDIEIAGDVDFSIGNIDFLGNVIIKGDVNPGFTVKGKNVTIGGVCQDCIITAEENIDVHYGIKGHTGCTLTAGGYVTVGYSENSYIYAKGLISIKKYSYNSFLNTGSAVHAEDKSTITGGEINSFTGGKFYNLGTKVNTTLILRVGRMYDAADRIQAALEETERLRQTYDKITQALAGFDENLQRTNPKLAKLAETRELIIQRLDYYEKTLEEIKTESVFANPIIEVTGDIHEGVILRFFTRKYPITSHNRSVRYYFNRSSNMMEEENI